MPKIHLITLAAVALIATLSSCSGSGTPSQGEAATSPSPLPSDTLIPPTPAPTTTATETALPPTSTASPTHTPLPATETPTVTFTETATPTSITGSASLPGASGDMVWMYLIQIKSGGTVACGDSAVPLSSGIARTNKIPVDVEAGLASLLALKNEYYGSLYNPLFRSTMKVNNVTFDRKSGTVYVWLRGTYKPSSDECDHLRVKAQIWSTVRQFRGVKRTIIYINDKLLGDRVSNDK